MSQVSFSQIPANLRVPLFAVEFDNSQAGQNQVQKNVLILGQALTSVPEVPTYTSDENGGIALFGRGSMLARMVKAYRAADKITPIYCLPVADAGGGATASGSISFTGPSTAAGTLSLYIAGQLVPVAVTSAMTAIALATAVIAAITAATDLPVTAAVDETHAYQVNLTCKWKGLTGNAIDVRLNYQGALGGEALPAGLGVTIVAMASGATDPDLSGVAAALGSQSFDYIVFPYSGATQLNTIKALLDNVSGRWSWTSQLFGQAFTALSVSAAAQATVSQGVAAIQTVTTARNDPHVTIFSYYDSPTPPWEAAADWTATLAPSISADPARPVQTLPLSTFLAPPLGSRFAITDEQALLTSGAALAAIGDDGSASIMRCVTTYQKNADNVPDQSYLDAETLFTLMEITRRLKAVVTQTFGRSKLAQDGTKFAAGQPVATPKIIRAALISAYAGMEADGLVQDRDAFKAALFVAIDDQDASRVNVLFPPYLVGGLRIFAALNQFRLEAPAAT